MNVRVWPNIFLIVGGVLIAVAAYLIGWQEGYADGWNEATFQADCIRILALDPLEPGCEQVAAKLQEKVNP